MARSDKKKTVDGNERGKKNHPIKRIGFLEMEMFTYKETGLFCFVFFLNDTFKVSDFCVKAVVVFEAIGFFLYFVCFS